MSTASQFFSSGGGDPKYWVSGTTYAAGNVARSPTDHQRYVRITAGAGTTDPASDTTNWRPDGGRAIKSIQRGVVSLSGLTSGTVTIAAVNTAKSQINHLGANTTVTATLALTNSTTVTASFSEYTTSNVAFQLTEYY